MCLNSKGVACKLSSCFQQVRPHQGVGREKLPPLEVTTPAQPTASSLNTNLHQNPDKLEFERNTGEIIREILVR